MKLGAPIAAQNVYAPQPQKTPNVLDTKASETNAEGLTPEQVEVVQDMRQRDQEVRAHEQAHSTIGGPYAGAPQYTTETGPDGQQYAVAGEVAIDVSPIANNPEATIRKMEIVARAALAPAEPSPQDKQVAAKAQQLKLQAQVELQSQKSEEHDGKDDQLTPIEEAINQAQQPKEANTNNMQAQAAANAYEQTAALSVQDVLIDINA